MSSGGVIFLLCLFSLLFYMNSCDNIRDLYRCVLKNGEGTKKAKKGALKDLGDFLFFLLVDMCCLYWTLDKDKSHVDRAGALSRC